MATNDSKVPLQPKNGPPKKPPSASFIVSQLKRLATAVGAEMSEARMEIYLEKFSTFDPKVIEAAISMTIDKWDKPNMLPPVGFILDQADAHWDSVRKRVL